jgi:DNA-binding transcriptional LysR family regulator
MLAHARTRNRLFRYHDQAVAVPLPKLSTKTAAAWNRLSMEIRELRYFVALAEELHFARAAARIGIEQSPLSKAITEMERRLGVQLFTRTRRSTTLTSIGETLLRDARGILAQIDSAHHNLLAAAEGRSGRLHVAVCDGVAHPRLARLLTHIRNDAPNVDIKMRHVSSSEQMRGLLSRHIDIGFGLSPIEDPQIRSVPLWKDHVVIVWSTKSSDGQRNDRPPDSSLPLILLGDRSPMTSHMLGARLNKAVEYVPSMELLLTLVSAGCGIGAISAAQAETLHRPDLTMQPLDVADGAITTFMVQRNEPESALVARFTAQARVIQ